MRRITIGRLSTNDVCINDRSVTREHCILTVHSDGRCELTDCNSTNGTFVNGNRIHGTVPLQPNDYVRVGNQQLPWRNYIYGDGVYGGSGVPIGTAVPAFPEEPSTPQEETRIRPV